MDLVALSAMVGVGFVWILGTALIVARFLKHVPQGQALIVTTTAAEPRVSFNTVMVLPVINRAEFLDLTHKAFTASCRGDAALTCADGLRLEVELRFGLQVNPTREDVLNVARSMGCAPTFDLAAVRQRFEPRFVEAIKEVASRMRLGEITDDRTAFKARVLEVIGADLGGYRIEETVIVSARRAPELAPV